ncbi:MAG: hypothetical protein ACR2ID_03060 [Chthoniobacterales bacterium]
MTAPSDQFRRRLGTAALLVVILAVYLMEAHARRVVFPTGPMQGDQAAYLQYARGISETGYSFVGDRNRMPGYPFLLSLIYRQGSSDAEFLARAQTFNVNLTAALLLLLFFLLRLHFSRLVSLAWVAATAFGVFIYRAPLAQTEVTFYVIGFGMFLCFWRMFVAPNPWLAVWTGCLAGVAHLFKASVLPALAIFLVVFAVKIIRAPGRLRAALQLALVLLCFLAVVFPYLQTSKRVFGHYFYNVNSTFYFWCDSWAEAAALTRAHGDRTGWPTLPPEQIPSAAKYWREHSFADIAARLTNGFIATITHNARVEGYWKYALLLSLAAGIVALRQRKEAMALLREQPFPALFVALFFAAYVLLYSWFERMTGDSRFVLALFLPFVFSLSKLIQCLVVRRTTPLAGRAVTVLSALTGLVMLFAAFDAVFVAAQLRQRVPAKARATSGISRLDQSEVAALPAIHDIHARVPRIEKNEELPV